MTNEMGAKPFDCVKSIREIRNRINSEIADMSYAELSQWLDRQVEEALLRAYTDRPEAGKTAYGADRGARSGFFRCKDWRRDLRLMATERHAVTPQLIESLLTWVKTDAIAIPETQRPLI